MKVISFVFLSIRGRLWPLRCLTAEGRPLPAHRRDGHCFQAAQEALGLSGALGSGISASIAVLPSSLPISVPGAFT